MSRYPAAIDLSNESFAGLLDETCDLILPFFLVSGVFAAAVKKSDDMEAVARRATRATLAARDENVARPLAGKAGGLALAANQPVKRAALTTAKAGPTLRSKQNDVEPPPAKREKTEASSSENATIVCPSNAPISPECELMTQDFVDDIKAYAIEMEPAYMVDELFLQGKTIHSRQRAILVDWIVQVHARFHLLVETLHLTVYLLDRYLEKNDVAKNDLQLLGITAMFVASKYEETFVPDIKDFEFISDGALCKKDMLRMETAILLAVDCDLGRTHPIAHLRSFSTKLKLPAATHHLSKYVEETCLLDHTMSSVRPCLIAAAALSVAVRVKHTDSRDAVHKEFARLVASLPVENVHDEMKRLTTRIASQIVLVRSINKLKSTWTKFATAKVHRVSEFTDQELAVLESMADSK